MIRQSWDVGDERLPQRFWDKIQVDATSGCWNWTGAKGKGGYGNFIFERRYYNAHRIAYIRLVAPVAQGLQLDHRCRNRACCNPAHLEPVTARENTLRGGSPSAQQASLTHCHKGHPFGDYRMIGGKRSRRCLECMRERDRERYPIRQQRKLLGSFDRGDGYDARDPNAPDVPECPGCDGLMFDGVCADCTTPVSTVAALASIGPLTKLVAHPRHGFAVIDAELAA